MPLPDSVNEIVFVQLVALAILRQRNLTLHHRHDYKTMLALGLIKKAFTQRSMRIPTMYHWGPHADFSSRAPVSLRQSSGTKCAYVCLCSCYHQGMWDLHLKQLSPRSDPISHCKGALLLSHLCHTGSLRLLELYIMCLCVCVKNERRDAARGIKTWLSKREIKCQELFI